MEYRDYKTDEVISREQYITNGLGRGDLVVKGDCGCVVIQDRTSEAYIVYCYKHESAPDLYEACKEGADNFKFERQAGGRIEHWVDNNRGDKAFTKKEKLMLAQAIRDYLTFLEDRTFKGIKQALTKIEK